MNERDKELAKQVGISDYEIEDYDLLAMFATLIRADEREACAELCEQWDASHPLRLAESIRARGNT